MEKEVDMAMKDSDEKIMLFSLKAPFKLEYNKHGVFQAIDKFPCTYVKGQWNFIDDHMMCVPNKIFQTWINIKETSHIDSTVAPKTYTGDLFEGKPLEDKQS